VGTVIFLTLRNVQANEQDVQTLVHIGKDLKCYESVGQEYHNPEHQDLSFLWCLWFKIMPTMSRLMDTHQY